MQTTTTYVFNGEIFAKDIWYIRKKKMKLSVEAAADKMGMNACSLSRAENGKQPSLNAFYTICKFLDITDFSPYFKEK